MSTLSCIHINPVKNNSEAHNERRCKLDYVRDDLTHLNQSSKDESISDARQRIEAAYKATVGQKMQKKATPIREGVVLLAPGTNMQHLEKLSSALENRFGIKTIQTHIHEDEGHTDKETREWKPNRHAHMVFDWTQPNGKAVRLNKADMAEVQTITADCLEMQRGQSSDKKHLAAIEYKAQQIEKEAKELQEKKAKLDKEIKAAIKAAKEDRGIIKGLKKLQGKDPLSLAKKEIGSLNEANSKQRHKIILQDRAMLDLQEENKKKDSEIKKLSPYKKAYQNEYKKHQSTQLKLEKITEKRENLIDISKALGNGVITMELFKKRLSKIIPEWKEKPKRGLRM